MAKTYLATNLNLGDALTTSGSLLLKRKLPRNSRNTQKFIVEKKLPQISRIYTDVSKMFCVFREFCGSKYLCKSVKSVGEYSLPVCSVNSVNSVGGFNIGALSDMLVHFLLWQAAKPSGDKCTPWSVPPKTSSAGTTVLHGDRCRQQDSIGCCCGTPCRLR